jgi:putative inorganic carbon (HCO3(-)) transporter
MIFQPYIRQLPKWPILPIVLLYAVSLVLAAFFTGTNSFLFLPPLLMVGLMGFINWAPGLWRGWSWPQTATVAGMACFGLLLIISSIWSKVPYISLLFAYLLGCLPFLFFVFITMQQEQKSVRFIVQVTLAILTGFAIWGVIHYFFFNDTAMRRIHKPMLSPNNLSIIFSMGLFMTVPFYILAKHIVAKISFFTLMTLMMLTLLMTQSRAGIICAVVALIILMATTCRTMGWRGILAVTGALLLAYGCINVLDNGLFRSNILVLSIPTNSQSFIDRIAIYESSLQIFKDYFWTGIGLGTFFFTYPRYRATEDFSDGYFVHSDPLQFALEMGVFAPVVLYGTLICILLRTIKAMRALPAKDKRVIELMAPFCGLLTILTHTHFDFHLYLLFTMLLLPVPLAWWYIVTEDILKDKRVTLRLSIGRPVYNCTLLGVVFVLLLSWPVRAGLTTLDMPLFNKALHSHELDKAERILVRMKSYAPSNYYALYTSEGRLLTDRLLSLREGDHKDIATYVATAEEAFKSARYYNEDFATIDGDWAKLYFNTYDWFDPRGLDRAAIYLRRATTFNPLDWDSRIGLATIYQNQGKVQDAISVLAEGRKWPMPRTMLAVRLFLFEAELQISLGNVEEATILARMAEEFIRVNGLKP